MAASYDVVVVGAGPVGAACARELALGGRRVLVLERGGEIGQAWRAAAGMLAPQIESHRDDPLLQFGIAAREHYAPLAASLAETTGVDLGLWQEGIAAVAASEAEASDLKARVAWQRQQGQLSDWLDATEVRTRWPWLGDTAGALWAVHDGAIEPEKLVAALLSDARRLGAVLLPETVTAIEQRQDRVVAVTGLGGQYPCEAAVLAAGAWAGRIEGLPRPLSVEPVRGQMLAFPWPRGIPRAIVYGKGGYVVARGDEAIVGSTMEFAGFRSQVTADGLEGIVAAATALAPALTAPGAHRRWAGLRPVTPDGLPIIGPEPRLQGLWYATGHGRNGILLAGLTGLLIRQLLNGEPTAEDLQPFSPGRFWQW